MGCSLMDHAAHELLVILLLESLSVTMLNKKVAFNSKTKVNDFLFPWYQM